MDHQAFLPVTEVMMQASLATYAKVASAVGGLALVIFTARLSVLATVASGPSHYADALKSLIVFYLALALSPFMFKAIVMTSGAIALKLAGSEVASNSSGTETVFGELTKLIADDHPFVSFFINLFPMSITYLASGVYSVLLGTLCALLPVVLLYQTLSNSSQSISAVACAVLTLSSWPILWNAMALLSTALWPTFAKTTLSGAVFWFVVKALQLLSPLFAGMFFKSFSLQGAAKSQGVVRVITKVVSKK